MGNKICLCPLVAYSLVSENQLGHGERERRDLFAKGRTDPVFHSSVALILSCFSLLS